MNHVKCVSNKLIMETVNIEKTKIENVINELGAQIVDYIGVTNTYQNMFDRYINEEEPYVFDDIVCIVTESKMVKIFSIIKIKREYPAADGPP